MVAEVEQAERERVRQHRGEERVLAVADHREGEREEHVEDDVDAVVRLVLRLRVHQRDDVADLEHERRLVALREEDGEHVRRGHDAVQHRPIVAHAAHGDPLARELGAGPEHDGVDGAKRGVDEAARDVDEPHIGHVVLRDEHRERDGAHGVEDGADERPEVAHGEAVVLGLHFGVLVAEPVLVGGRAVPVQLRVRLVVPDERQVRLGHRSGVWGRCRCWKLVLVAGGWLFEVLVLLLV
mmetsp:Transcript_17449/g.54133  ORF Transcript_17449/g.54133 Transcript_17449/m.54133 type:complete len:239 (-) Transcript_17449:256-972(-)